MFIKISTKIQVVIQDLSCTELLDKKFKNRVMLPVVINVVRIE